jgi:hypothetical protein
MGGMKPKFTWWWVQELNYCEKTCPYFIDILDIKQEYALNGFCYLVGEYLDYYDGYICTCKEANEASK